MAAIEHRQPDRVHHSISVSHAQFGHIGHRLQSHLVRHLGPDSRSARPRYTTLSSNSPNPITPCLDHFGVDVIDVGRAFNQLRTDSWHPATLPNGEDRCLLPAWFSPTHGSRRRLGSVCIRWNTDCGDASRRAISLIRRFFPYGDGYPTDFRRLGRSHEQGALGRALAHPARGTMPSEDRIFGANAEEHVDHGASFDEQPSLDHRRRLQFIRMGFVPLRRLDNFLMDLASSAHQRMLSGCSTHLLERHLAFPRESCALRGGRRGGHSAIG